MISNTTENLADIPKGQDLWFVPLTFDSDLECVRIKADGTVTLMYTDGTEETGPTPWPKEKPLSYDGAEYREFVQNQRKPHPLT